MEGSIMDDQRFVALTKRIGSGNRRGFLKGLLGLGGVALGGSLLIDEADAARRGYAGPKRPGGDENTSCPDRCDGDTLIQAVEFQPGICTPLTIIPCSVLGRVCRDGACREPD
jgi:hypothetical protein